MAADEDKKRRDELLADLEERRTKIKAMGGEKNVQRQKERGKLTARERIDQLLDKGTFREVGMFAQSRGDINVASDGVITGYGEINRRKVYIFSQDFTSSGGTLSEKSSDGAGYY